MNKITKTIAKSIPKQHGVSAASSSFYNNHQLYNKTWNAHVRPNISGQVPLSEGVHSSLGQPLTKHHSLFLHQNGAGRVLTPTMRPDNPTALILRNEILRSRDLYTIFGGVWSGSYDPLKMDDKTRRNIYKAVYAAWESKTETTLSIINGRMAMGGCMLSIFGADHVVATPGAMYSCVDPIMGMIPEGGQTYFLAHMNAKYAGLGTFLALTGYELSGRDLINLDVATQFHNSSGFGQYVLDRIQESYSQPHKAVFNQALEEVLAPPNKKKKMVSLTPTELKLIEDCFANATCYEDLEKIDGEMKGRIQRIPPKVITATIRAIQYASELTLDEAMNMEFRVATNIANSNDLENETVDNLFMKNKNAFDLHLPGSLYADFLVLSEVPSKFINKKHKSLQQYKLESKKDSNILNGYDQDNKVAETVNYLKNHVHDVEEYIHDKKKNKDIGEILEWLRDRQHAITDDLEEDDLLKALEGENMSKSELFDDTPLKKKKEPKKEPSDDASQKSTNELVDKLKSEKPKKESQKDHVTTSKEEFYTEDKSTNVDKKVETLPLNKMTPSQISMYFSYHKKSKSLRERPTSLPKEHSYDMNKPHHESYDELDFSNTVHPSKIKIAMVTTDRPHYFKVALESLSNVVYFNKDQLHIYEYGSFPETKKIVRQNNLKHIINPRKQFREGAMHIAYHYKFILDDMFKKYPEDDAFIIVEDDMIFSPDFLIYFSKMHPLLKDPTVYAISAYNDNGFKGLVHNDNVAYRTDFFIGLGWLVKRNLYQDEWKGKWPMSHWDHFLRQPHIRKNRHTIYPEISRVYHIGYKGTHSSINLYNQYFRDILLNGNGHAIMGINPNWREKVGEAMIQVAKSDTPTLDYLSPLENYDEFLKQYLYRERKGEIPGKGVHVLNDQSKLNAFHILEKGDEFGDIYIGYLPSSSAKNVQGWDSISKYFGIWHSFPVRSMLNGIVTFYWGQYRIVLIASLSTLKPSHLKVSELTPLHNIKIPQPAWYHEQKAPTISNILMGEVGESCDSVCSKKSLQCSSEGLSMINNCYYLQRHFSCSACLGNQGHDQPVLEEKTNRCLFTNDKIKPTCAASHGRTRRLCACTKPKEQLVHTFHWEWHDHLTHAQNEKSNPSRQRMDSITKFHIRNPEIQPISHQEK